MNLRLRGFSYILSFMRDLQTEPVAVLYQATPAPVIDGIRKPMKAGGYSDSGADIAFALQNAGVPIVTPADRPDSAHQMDWVFPDTADGIQAAIDKGAKVLWANTVLFKGHPIEKFQGQGLKMIGHPPTLVQRYDDKWATNSLLRAKGLPVTPSVLASEDNVEGTIHLDELTEAKLAEHGVTLPAVVKPVRGRGSQGVVKVDTFDELLQETQSHLHETETVDGEEFTKYGASYIIEKYMEGTEVTATVMPAGDYLIDGKTVSYDKHWSMPLVKRFNHKDGIALYNGVVAVTTNSCVIPINQMTQGQQSILEACARAAEIIGAKAPIRIDCRDNDEDQYTMFDLNMKPNMTGKGRPGRDDQNSLTAIAADELSWDFEKLLLNMLRQAWGF